MNIEDFIRERARMQWSRSMVAAALGISFRKLTAITDAMEGEIKWPPLGKSVDQIRGYANRSVLGSQENRVKSALRMIQIRQSRLPRYTVGAYTGTVAEQYEHWSPFVSVSLCQVRRRIKEGHNILDALFKPRQTHTGWGHMPKLHLRRA